MFENLKAFIRHGKQANDLKKKPVNSNFDTVNEFGYPVSGDTITSNGYPSDLSNLPSNVSNLPSQLGGLDVTLISKEEVEKLQLDDEARARAEAQAQVEAQSRAQATYENQRYQEAAHHIVEQERLQKLKSVKYPGLENYEVLEQMGEGAFSIVYKARHLPSNQHVAIKILRKFQMDQAQKQAVLKEVTIMRQLNHPNIVKFVEFIDSEPYYYIVQELAVGGEIFTAIVKYTYFSEDLTRHVITQVAHAIRYLHEEVGIVHRDIKPENLLYLPIESKPSINPVAKLRKSDDPSSKQDEGEFVPGVGGGGIGIVKIADFGLSKQIWEHNTKTPCGTVGYTAPEIVRDERYSKEVDMWAIGCVLYTLLCGFPPFYDERIETLTEKVAKGEYTFLTPWWDEISADAKHCVSKLLTVDPAQRYTIDDFLNDPWMNKTAVAQPAPAMAPPVRRSAPANYEHPIQSANNNAKYSKKFTNAYNNGMYSPAALALRDVFDISTAVHRMGEEAALSSKMNTKTIQDLVEEEEENSEEVDAKGHVLNSAQKPIDRASRKAPRYQNAAQKPQTNMFDLNLKGASILERRKNKQIPVNI
ncbi:Pkinase-domain-containing protein [Suhomyces tanzawaensis NRRL Y-17324]|uniref:Pkinase-domain-containing protein n=1 Tax=Suhomyces tanzawaensis NRRL Y-17324 TaxID=984487 RepID=A0A1E4SKZ7_9ASCO|nr:Pkinase-domain-containing protein [Suhomyces tanzawaensis NRRL Y-17324]ODV80176.1 Pkinase-domain-containing protein [Suhomyces tanzawaensis NRRL Y-17324]